MTERKELGRITSAEIGMGGYQDAMFGVSFELSGQSWGVGDFWGTWADRPVNAKWTLADQSKSFANTMKRLRDLLGDAKRKRVSQLVNVPVEVTFDGNTLKSWLVLKEVL